MPTKITDGLGQDSLSGSPEKRYDIAPDGSLWALIVSATNPALAKFFRSTNGGATWTYSAGSDIRLNQSTAAPSFFIDADGFAHVSYVRWGKDPQIVVYNRGRPNSTATAAPGWTWTAINISPASGRLGVNSDVVAFRNGNGWVAFIAYDTLTSAGVQVAKVNISASSSLTVAMTATGPPSGGQALQVGSLEFAHTGNGRTPTAAPHLYLFTGVMGSSQPIRLVRAVYSGGTWTWEAAVTITSGNMQQTAFSSAWNGSTLYAAYAASSGTISVVEWTGSGAPTARNPPAAPGGTGTVLGLSLAVDPFTADLYLAWYDATDGDIRWSKFTRSTNTWSAWAISISRTASAEDGKVQLIKHPTRDSIDMIYANGSGTSWQIYSQQLSPLIRTPSAPTLVSPASGALVDVTNGITFSWKYNQVSPGDIQQAWAFRRVYSTTTEYWNASSLTWSSTIVWNSGTTTTLSFPAGAWTSGTNYTWSVATRSSTGANSIFSTARTLVATSAPVVSLILPVGLVYGDSTPIVWWNFDNPRPQRDYRIRIIPEQPGIDPDTTAATWDSGVVNSFIARTARIPVALANGGSYRAYVKATNIDGVVSQWAYSLFNISVTPPYGPLVEVRDEIDFVSGVPKVRLDVMGQSSFLDAGQNTSSVGWENDQNVTLADQAADIPNQVYVGFTMTSQAAGLMGVRTILGDPPLAPFGQTQQAGPLDFPVVPGGVYTGIASLRCFSTGRAARIRLRWYDADDGTGNLISEVVGDQVSINSLYYVQAQVTAVAPPNAVLCRMLIEVLGATAAGEGFYVAFPMLAPGRNTAWQPGGFAATQTVRIERSDDGGSTWNTIVERLKPGLTQQAVGYDRLMPFGTDVSYRAYTEVDPGLGAILSSTVSLVSTLTVDAERWAIRDPLDDAGEFYAYVVGWDKADDEQSSVHHPAGREYPVVDTEGIQSSTGSIDVFVFQDDIDFATEVLRRVTPFVLQSPLGVVFRARIIRRKYGIHSQRHRVITLDYIEVD